MRSDLAAKILLEIKKYGIYLQQDQERQNLVTRITGERPSASWWSHKRADQHVANSAAQCEGKTLISRIESDKILENPGPIAKKIEPLLLFHTTRDLPWTD